MNVKLNEVQDKKFPCNKCNFTIDCYLDFENLLKGIHHNVSVGDKLEFTYSDEKNVFCVKKFTTFNSLNDHQSNYIQWEKCAVCYHNEFEYKKHEECEH